MNPGRYLTPLARLIATTAPAAADQLPCTQFEQLAGFLSALHTAPIAGTPLDRVPRSCLATARRGDEVIALLNRNVRNRRLAEALKAYTLASQACRQEASP